MSDLGDEARTGIATRGFLKGMSIADVAWVLGISQAKCQKKWDRMTLRDFSDFCFAIGEKPNITFEPDRATTSTLDSPPKPPDDFDDGVPF